MKLEDLKAAVQEADNGAILVQGHLLARVIRIVYDVRGQGITVPHRKSLLIDRQLLLQHVEIEDLDLAPGRILPPKVILLARPAFERRHNAVENEATLLRYWRRLFHANIHLALERRISEGVLTEADIEQRVATFGEAEFQEIRRVLEQEQFLFPEASRRDVYVEFAAVFLELRYFVRDLVPTYFPGLREPSRIEELLARDVDAPGLFARTRLAGVAPPQERSDASEDEPSDFCYKLVREAHRQYEAGNTVRAAILRTRAARLAPAGLTSKLVSQVQNDLEGLTNRLQRTLKLTDDEAREWLKDLPTLLDKTGEEQWSVEARLLYDLQKACVEDEREVYTVDLVGWLQSAGRVPLRRPLPHQRLARITLHLRSAQSRLNQTRLSETDRAHLGRLLQTASRASEERLRARFHPLLASAIQGVGLQPVTPPEQAALNKVVEELLDRVVRFGFFTFSDVRDSISSNQLKLGDLNNPRDWARDSLLRLDRWLANQFDGVYRHGEIYLRGLQRLTSLNFGTPIGRAVTRFITLPILFTFLLMQGVDSAIHLWQEWVHGVPQQDHKPYIGIASVLAAEAFDLRMKADRPWATIVAFFALLLLVFLLMHAPPFRRTIWRGAWGIYRGVRLLFYDWPMQILPLPWVRQLLKSWPGQVFFALIFRPLVCCAVFALLKEDFFLDRSEKIVTIDREDMVVERTDIVVTLDWVRLVTVYILSALIFNSRPIRAFEEAGARGVYRLFDWLHSGLFIGLYEFFLRLFKRLLDGLEYLLYTVDELLRFRTGDSRASLVLRAVLGTAWFPISYLIRLYVVVLLEPFFNPLKTPLSLLTSKFVYPLMLAVGLQGMLTKVLTPYLWGLESLAAGIIWWGVLFWLPDAFAFLIWELKENWKLYTANRPAELHPVAVGPHGETMAQLFKPGFHSGQVPKLYAQLRKTEREARDGGSPRPARACREHLEELAETLKHFVEREGLVLLHLAPNWKKKPLVVARVALASNQVRFDLSHTDHPGPPFRMAIAEMGGWLVARVEEAGWIAQISSEDRGSLTRALSGIYKMAGVDLVYEKVQEQLPQGAIWKVERNALVVHFPGSNATFRYPLDGEGTLSPQPEGDIAPTLDPTRILFSRNPITWEEWVVAWNSEGASADAPTAQLLLPSTSIGIGNIPL